jgi:hypothetical protein
MVEQLSEGWSQLRLTESTGNCIKFVLQSFRVHRKCSVKIHVDTKTFLRALIGVLLNYMVFRRGALSQD